MKKSTIALATAISSRDVIQSDAGVMLRGPDQADSSKTRDFGVVPQDRAEEIAKGIASMHRHQVEIVDQTTGAVLRTIQAPKATAPATQVATTDAAEADVTQQETTTMKSKSKKAPKAGPKALAAMLPKVATPKGKAIAKPKAPKAAKGGRTSPKKAAATKARTKVAKPTVARKAPAPKAPKATKAIKAPKAAATDRQPTQRAAECLALTSRPLGASAAELTKLTGWRNAPWKAHFTNSRKAGWCDRYGYTLEVIKRDAPEGGTETAYRTTKN